MSRLKSRSQPASDMFGWKASLGKAAIPGDLVFACKLLLGDIEEKVQWGSQPEDYVGKASWVSGNPWGATHTFDAILKARTIDLATRVLVIIPMRCYTSWFRFTRQCLTLASISPGSIFNPATNYERLIVLYFPPFSAKLPCHDQHFNDRSDDHELVLLQMRRVFPGEQRKTHLQGLGKVLRKVAKLCWGDSRRMLLRILADTFEEIIEEQETLGSPRTPSRLSNWSKTHF
mgnify:FL=1